MQRVKERAGGGRRGWEEKEQGRSGLDGGQASFRPSRSPGASRTSALGGWAAGRPCWPGRCRPAARRAAAAAPQPWPTAPRPSAGPRTPAQCQFKRVRKGGGVERDGRLEKVGYGAELSSTHLVLGRLVVGALPGRGVVVVRQLVARVVRVGRSVLLRASEGARGRCGMRVGVERQCTQSNAVCCCVQRRHKR